MTAFKQEAEKFICKQIGDMDSKYITGWARYYKKLGALKDFVDARPEMFQVFKFRNHFKVGFASSDAVPASHSHAKVIVETPLRSSALRSLSFSTLRGLLF